MTNEATELKKHYRVIEIKRVLREGPPDIAGEFLHVAYCRHVCLCLDHGDRVDDDELLHIVAWHLAENPELETTQLLLKGKIPRRSEVAGWLQAMLEMSGSTHPRTRELFSVVLRGHKQYSGPDYIRITTSDRFKETVEVLAARPEHIITKALLAGHWPTREQITEPL